MFNLMRFDCGVRCTGARGKLSRSCGARPSLTAIPGRLRAVVICAKKGTPFYQTAAASSKDGKTKRTVRSSPKPKYIEGTEEPGASGSKGTVVPTEDAFSSAVPAKVENVQVPVDSEQSLLPLGDPVKVAASASLVVVIAWFLIVLFKRMTRPKTIREPRIAVSEMDARMKEMEEKMEEEFQNILAEQLEKKDADHMTQLVDERGQMESDFDGRLAAREREVRKALDAEFKVQLEKETERVREEANKEKTEIETQLSSKFDDEKSQIEVDWMKKLEEKEQEKEQTNKATLEAEELVKELKASQEHLKERDTVLESQLKEYETMLKTLKENHKVELDGAIDGFQSEISDMKEQIRLQEEEIERRRAVKEQERIRAAAALQETVQENGILTDEERQQQSVAVQTQTLPQTVADPHSIVPEQLPVHKNGLSGEVVWQAEIRMTAAATIIPHVDKVFSGGEDAFFVSSAGYGAMGVADGVGSWRADGVDPGAYSKQLMAAVDDCLKSSSEYPVNLMHLVEHAHSTAKSPGSATMSVALVHPDGLLEIANIGDCGVRVVRGPKCVFATEPMSHEFNMPYQLGNPKILPQTDWPSDAELYSFELQAGDVIVMGSDGLFDNVWDDDLSRIVNSFVGEGPTDEATAKEVSKRIADLAHYNAKQKNIRSPWAVHAASAGAVPMMKRLFPQGGKMDDCTVVVGFANRCT